MAEPDFDYLFKILVIGDSGVGKTSLLSRFCGGTFSENHRETLGIDFKIHTVELDGSLVKLQFWDTAGQERFRTVTTSFYRGAHGVVIVYDVTSQISFNNVPRWLQEVHTHLDQEVSKVLVGNKCDLAANKTVDYVTAKDYAEAEGGLVFLETSAKDATNVEQAFTTLAAQVRDRVGPPEAMLQSDLGDATSRLGVTLSSSSPAKEPERRRGGCC